MNKINLLSNLINKLIINKKNNNIIEIKPIKNELFNYNNKWDYTNIIYKNNNNNILFNIKHKYLIKKYIDFMVNQKLFNLKLNILSKDPIILYKNDNLYEVILFIYKPLINGRNINSNDLLITKLINNLMNNININNIKINIKPIILTYDYLDSTIYSKLLSKHISKFPKLEPIKNIKFNKNILNQILINRLNKNQIIENINILKLYKPEITSGNLIFKNTMIYSNLLHQYLIGNIWKFRGKNFNSESNARALKTWNNNKLNTSLSQILNNNKTKFKLNYYLSTITESQSNYISKNGKFNVKVTFNHF